MEHADYNNITSVLTDSSQTNTVTVLCTMCDSQHLKNRKPPRTSNPKNPLHFCLIRKQDAKKQKNITSKFYVENGAKIWPKLKNLKSQCHPSSCDKTANFSVAVFWFYVDPNAPGGRGGLPFKSDRDARRLALGCRLQILASLTVFGMERHYICPFRYR